MFDIVQKRVLNPTVTLMKIAAPLIAKKAKPGQFIILRTDEQGERIPLTIADFDAQDGTVTIIFQIVGATTEKLNHLQEGDCLADFVGPLGKPTEMSGLKKVAVIGGGVGCAIAYPVAKEMSKYDLLALPVVDREKRLVGIITVDDAIDVIEEEATEDIEKMAA
ncbi:MAG: CBS domain-containing protein, partial [Clostridia bacterium]|nr:CBS domain-containing protein [Clostridia bacterium]